MLVPCALYSRLSHLAPVGQGGGGGTGAGRLSTTKHRHEHQPSLVTQRQRLHASSRGRGGAGLRGGRLSGGSIMRHVACDGVLDLRLNTLLTSGDSTDHSVSPAVRSLSFLLPFSSPSLFLMQAALRGGMVPKLRALQLLTAGGGLHTQ
eukprot:scaffold8637_cov127-Isochrysis_galbana.AAC.4